jgi:hypothetical protein
MMQKNMTLLVEQGKKEGLIEDYPTNIIMGVLVSAVQGVVTPEFILYNNISMQKAGEMVLRIVFAGILSNKGKELFNQYKSGN